MILYGDTIPRESDSPADPDVVELRIVAVCYTYFGWSPWSDFEGEDFSEEEVYELTGGQTGWRNRRFEIGAEDEIDFPGDFIRW